MCYNKLFEIICFIGSGKDCTIPGIFLHGHVNSSS